MWFLISDLNAHIWSPRRLADLRTKPARRHLGYWRASRLRFGTAQVAWQALVLWGNSWELPPHPAAQRSGGRYMGSRRVVRRIPFAHLQRGFISWMRAVPPSNRMQYLVSDRDWASYALSVCYRGSAKCGSW
jgi:hypothetical protein